VQALHERESACADPGGAPQLVDGILEAALTVDEPGLVQVCARHGAAMARICAAVCGAAPFLAAHLRNNPHWLLRLAEEDLTQPRSPDEYEQRLSAELARHAPGKEATALRRCKYYELTRITVRELSADLVPADRASETLSELSHLADALLSQALAVAQQRLAERAGPPNWPTRSGEVLPLGFVVLGLGKLGSSELNYSSDVDLVYVCESREAATDSLEGQAQGAQELAPVEYFTRLAREFGRIVTEPTADGFLYRVDLDLRPEGKRGPLVVSHEGLADYYESWAATWEKAALMKARPVAGDLQLGWRILRSIDPMIYRSSVDYESVSAMRELKEKVEETRGAKSETFDVKVGTGGIRDVESVAQALQLLHGGRIPEIRQRSTVASLVALTQVGILTNAEADELLATYRFLRRTENRLQMVAERQIHRLPRQPEELERIARGMGFSGNDPAAEFQRALEQHRTRAKRAYERLFHPPANEGILAMFERKVPKLLANATTRSMLENLAAQFASEIQSSSNPQRALNNLERFIEGVGAWSFYYELLIDRPELVPRLTAMFAASEYLSTYLANYPRLIEPIFSDPNVLLLPRNILERDYDELANEAAAPERDEAEVILEALRLFHHRQVVNVGLLELGGKVTVLETTAALTDVAEVCIEGALALARKLLEQRAAALSATAREAEFLVVGMGKLASRELMHGSDLDVIFLYDVPDADDHTVLEAQEYFVRLAQKLIWALQTRTRFGICYDIDARLRPSGSQGMLVTSLDSFKHYHEKSAALWERQALLRARAVAGSSRLADAFEKERRTILRKPLEGDFDEEVHRIRMRMEAELGRETVARHDFKTGRGGMQDVETVVQVLQLRHGAEQEELFDVEPVVKQLDRLQRRGFLEESDAEALRQGWKFLQRLSSRLRVVENRSISDLDEERGDLEALALGLGYESPQRTGGARRALLDEYRRHTAAIRDAYVKILGVDTPG
jgi:glutamate-ammonia-ligase adenylyltransferase